MKKKTQHDLRAKSKHHCRSRALLGDRIHLCHTDPIHGGGSSTEYNVTVSSVYIHMCIYSYILYNVIATYSYHYIYMNIYVYIAIIYSYI